MHELGITREVVAVASAHSAGARVRRVTLEIGKLSTILPDAIRFCFPVCAAGTAVEGADLEIISVSGRAHCRKCDRDVELGELFGCCPCGSGDLDWLSGTELKIKSIEVD